MPLAGSGMVDAASRDPAHTEQDIIDLSYAMLVHVGPWTSEEAQIGLGSHEFHNFGMTETPHSEMPHSDMTDSIERPSGMDREVRQPCPSFSRPAPECRDRNAGKSISIPTGHILSCMLFRFTDSACVPLHSHFGLIRPFFACCLAFVFAGHQAFKARLYSFFFLFLFISFISFINLDSRRPILSRLSSSLFPLPPLFILRIRFLPKLA